MWWLLIGTPELLEMLAFSSLCSRRDHFYGDSFKQHFMSLSVFTLLLRPYLQGDLKKWKCNELLCIWWWCCKFKNPSQILPMAGVELVSLNAGRGCVWHRPPEALLCGETGEESSWILLSLISLLLQNLDPVLHHLDGGDPSQVPTLLLLTFSSCHHLWHCSCFSS